MMSLRDYFAAQIAAGDAAAGEGWGNGYDVDASMIERRVRLYYRIADAMVRAGSTAASAAKPRAVAGAVKAAASDPRRLHHE